MNEARQRLRSQMPVTNEWAYFDHAAVAPISLPAQEAIAKWLRQAAYEGDTVWLEWARQVNDSRRTAAQLIGASVDEIALVPNTTAGINFVAEGIDWQLGDNVVTLDDEFPANLYPWMHLTDLGVETRLVETEQGRVNMDALASACDERTRVVTVSWIGYKNGCRRDLDSIGKVAHAAGAYLFVDAIQGVGAFPINVAETPIDFMAADGHKWQLGPEGAGFAYLRRDHLSALRTVGVGWNSVVQGGDFDRIELTLRNSAQRYEGGSQNMAGLIGWGASLQLLDSLGMENVADAILDVTDLACDRLRSIGAEIQSPRNRDERSGIVVFDLPGVDAQQARKSCLERRVALACRGGRLRISPHAYNNSDDVDRLIDALAGI